MPRQLYPEQLRYTAILFRFVALILGIILLVFAIIVSGHGVTPIPTYVGVIWSLLLCSFDLICLCTRRRLPPGGLMCLDLIALGFLIGGVINLTAWNYGTKSEPQLAPAETWIQLALALVHLLLVFLGVIDCSVYAKMARVTEEEVVSVHYSSRSTARSSRRSRRS